MSIYTGFWMYVLFSEFQDSRVFPSERCVFGFLVCLWFWLIFDDHDGDADDYYNDDGGDGVGVNDNEDCGGENNDDRWW